MKLKIITLISFFISLSAKADDIPNEVKTYNQISATSGMFNMILAFIMFLIICYFIYKYYSKRLNKKTNSDKPFGKPTKSDTQEIGRLIKIQKMKDIKKKLISLKTEDQEILTLISDINKEIKILTTDQIIWYRRENNVNELLARFNDLSLNL